MKHRSVVSNFIIQYPVDSPVVVALFRRSHHPNVHTYQGKLAPISGGIDATDSDPTAAAVRELREETQLIVDRDVQLWFVGKPFYVEDQDLQRSWTVHPFSWTLHADERKITLNWEHESLRWTTPADILSGKIQNDCVPQLGKSLRRVYSGPGGMFKTPYRTGDFGKAFLNGVWCLRLDKTNGARVLATNALKSLHEMLKLFQPQDEWWHDIRVAAYQLIYRGRPSMKAAISSAVLNALNNIQTLSDQILGHDEAVDVLQQCVDQREELSRKTCTAFVSYIKLLLNQGQAKPELTILTLSCSTTIYSAIKALLLQMSTLHIQLLVLESRPKCEGVKLASALLQEGRKNDSFGRRLKITMAPDAHMAYLARQAAATGVPAALVLGADEISPSGHVSNKMGSCAAAIVVKALAPEIKVVVLSETDKIAKAADLSVYQERKELPAEEMKGQSHEHNDPTEVIRIWPEAGVPQADVTIIKEAKIGVENVYFEWVPSQYIDVYVGEEGVLTSEQIRAKSIEKAELEERIFGDLYEDD